MIPSIDSIYKSINVATTLSKSKQDKIKLTPMIREGFVIENYFLDQCGNPWSNKSGSFVPLTPNYAGSYPTIKPSIYGVAKTENLHRVVAETFVPFSCPAGISKEHWKATPEAVKDHVRSLYIVNHIDHDKSNFHPTNLEWVTAKGNSAAYHKFNSEIQ